MVCFGMVAAILIGSALILEGCKERGDGNGTTPTDQEYRSTTEQEMEQTGDEFEDAAQRGERGLERTGESAEESMEGAGERIEDAGERTGERIEDTGERTGERIEDTVE